MLLGAVAGLRAPSDASLPQHVRVVAFHGTNDRINPYAGSGTARWNESVLDAAIGWARANGLPTEPEESQVAPALTRLAFGPQEHPGAVTLWVSHGAGHTWPGSRLSIPLRLLLGRTSHEIDATEELWHVLTSP